MVTIPTYETASTCSLAYNWKCIDFFCFESYGCMYGTLNPWFRSCTSNWPLNWLQYFQQNLGQMQQRQPRNRNLFYCSSSADNETILLINRQMDNDNYTWTNITDCIVSRWTVHFYIIHSSLSLCGQYRNTERPCSPTASAHSNCPTSQDTKAGTFARIARLSGCGLWKMLRWIPFWWLDAIHSDGKLRCTGCVRCFLFDPGNQIRVH